jgi:hypothetical protein
VFTSADPDDARSPNPHVLAAAAAAAGTAMRIVSVSAGFREVREEVVAVDFICGLLAYVVGPQGRSKPCDRVRDVQPLRSPTRASPTAARYRP